jgi:type IV pilus assembly protein PilE
MQMHKRPAGYSLIELVIAMGIMAILAKIGFDNYRNYVVRSNRAVARATLSQLAAKQETYNLQNAGSGYASTFAPLNGQSGTSFYINRDAAAQAASDNNTIYQVSLTTSGSGATMTYAVQASAQGSQANWDSGCYQLTLNSSGLKQAASGNSGSTTLLADPTQCWEH